MFLYSFIVSALIVVLSMTHLKWWRSKTSILISSLLLGSLVTLMILVWGGHSCDDGKPPTYLAWVGGLLAGAVPWCRSFSLKIRRMLAFSIAMLFVTFVGLLVSSYHSVNITGNPELANGRYWHTSLTGMYPRGAFAGQHDLALMVCLRERIYELTQSKENEPDEEQPDEAPDADGSSNP